MDLYLNPKSAGVNQVANLEAAQRRNIEIHRHLRNNWKMIPCAATCPPTKALGRKMTAEAHVGAAADSLSKCAKPQPFLRKV